MAVIGMTREHSPLERKLLSAFRRRPNAKWGVEDIAKVIYDDGRQWPKNYRQSVNAIMRHLESRTLGDRLVVVRVAGARGRGNKSAWSLMSN